MNPRLYDHAETEKKFDFRTRSLVAPRRVGGLLGMTMVTLALALGTAPQQAWADPCGMVPPIYMGAGLAIKRIGVQKTYVFYKDGVETFVIRPGFSGKVDEFGMLIPFPTPPAIRKVSDDIFAHIAAAIDPPEVVIGGWGFRRGGRVDMLEARIPLGYLKGDEVHVIKEEAVGMYQVVVLDAGSAAALRRWMDEHGYKFPNGMDEACQDYVDQGWCFVAIRTRVGQKKGVDPKPGMREVNSKLPEGSTFDGHVQGMGFRFLTPKLVVPMRLSSFNEGELHNVVYLLADRPYRINDMSRSFVVRQLTGTELFRNVTQPLPVRLMDGASLEELPDWWKNNLPAQRNPAPRNGLAKELFASDLLAAGSAELSHPFEEAEKELLNISERLGLRGREIDTAIAQALQQKRERTLENSLAMLKKMTLTVIDGDFPREVLAEENLTFAYYEMPSEKNNPQSYDARLFGPAPKQSGKRLSQADPIAVPRGLGKRSSSPVGVGVLGLLAVPLLWGRRHRRFKATGLLVVIALLATSTRSAQAEHTTLTELIWMLDEPGQAAAAVEKLIARGKEAVPALLDEAFYSAALARKGWAIVCLSEIGGEKATQALQKLYTDPGQPSVVRNWAAAARVQMAASAQELLDLSDLVGSFPSLRRPLTKRLIETLRHEGNPVSTENLLSAVARFPQLQQPLSQHILDLGANRLLRVMVAGGDQSARRMAASYLATLAVQGDRSVGPMVIEAYRFDSSSQSVPWDGGPLFVPSLNWQSYQARELARHLVCWHLWADRHGRGDLQRQIHNNLRSLQLARAAGYESPGWQDVGTDKWLRVWGRAFGRQQVRAILTEQGVLGRYPAILDGM